MPVRAAVPAGGLVASIALGTNHSRLPPGGIFFQRAEQCHALARTLASLLSRPAGAERSRDLSAGPDFGRALLRTKVDPPIRFKIALARAGQRCSAGPDLGAGLRRKPRDLARKAVSRSAGRPIDRN